MKHTRITLYIDLLFCLVILPVIITMAPVDRWFVNHTFFMVMLIVYLYALYFVYRKMNLPALVVQRKFKKIFWLMLILLCVTKLVGDFPLPKESDAPWLTEARQHLRSRIVWFFFLIVTGFSLSIELMLELFRQMLLKQEMETEKNKAELALYKAQINPHFLFNTLNALYGLVLTKSDKTESAFIKFSHILKYMYSHATSETIAVDSEIEYIRHYIDLQSLRLNRHTHVVFESRADNPQEQIPPMILITFVENAFKYGASPDEDCTILIRIVVEDGNLFFETENAIMRGADGTDSAIGIENCRKRLELLFPGRFELMVSEKEGIFSTRLTIQLK